MYSQSRVSNKETRGLDVDTYVPTRLDTRLREDILKSKYRLVIITGNAGDGKTAFIQKIEDELFNEKQIVITKRDNGSTFSIDGHKFETNYDGSQDDNDLQNEEVLDTFFEYLSGDKINFDAIDICKIIAINEGKLLDFLFKSPKKEKYRHLQAIVEDQHILHKYDDNLPIILINLNYRSIVDGELDDLTGDNLFEKILTEFSRQDHWKDCNACPCKLQCHVKFNVDTMNHPQHGVAVKKGLKTLFQILHLRKVQHITIRDLRSALSYILFNMYTCEEIASNADDPTFFLSKVYYNSVYDLPNNIFNERDRILILLNKLDPGVNSNPKEDNRLSTNFFHDINSEDEERKDYFWKYDGRSEYEEEILKSYFESRPQSYLTEYLKTHPTERMNEAIYFLSVKRKYYFEGIFPTKEDRMKLLPYRALMKFIASIRGDVNLTETRKELVEAISVSERIYNRKYKRDYLMIRTSDNIDMRIKSFYRFPSAEFMVNPKILNKNLERYIENSSNELELIYGKDQSKKLAINLDLYELLVRIKQGYIPSQSEIRGLFLNLYMFKRIMSSDKEHKDQIFLTKNDDEFFSISKLNAGKFVFRSE